MSKATEMIMNEEAQGTSAKKKLVSVGLAAMLSLSCLGAGLAYLTDVANTDHNVSLAGFEKIDDDTTVEDIFDINYTNGLEDIANAKPGQEFEAQLTVTNEDYSVDSSYIMIETKVPVWKDADGAITPLIYNWNTEDWDISGVTIPEDAAEGLTYVDVVAKHKAIVAAGAQTSKLFDGISIDSTITREKLIAIGQALGAAEGEDASGVVPFNMSFDASGIQSTGFTGYSDALAAL